MAEASGHNSQEIGQINRRNSNDREVLVSHSRSEPLKLWYVTCWSGPTQCTATPSSYSVTSGAVTTVAQQSTARAVNASLTFYK